MKLTLQRRYTLAIVAIVAIVVGGLSSLLIAGSRWSAAEITDASARSTAGELLDRLVEHGSSLSETLALNLANPFYDFDMERMEHLLSATLRQQDVVAVTAVDVDGSIVHDGSELVLGFGERLERASLDEALASGRIATTFDPDSVHLTTPIVIGDEPIGALHVELSRASTRQRIAAHTADLQALTRSGLRRSLAMALASGLLVLIAGLYVAHRLARGLTGPIYQLVERAREIGRGEYSPRLDLERRDELGELARAFDEMSDDLLRGNEAIRHLAYHDSLTSLPNRARFEELLERALEARLADGRPGALMFVDLDHFKRINDTLGHKAGDDLLIEVAGRLSGVLRSADALVQDCDEPNRLARQGGDEFTVLLPRVRDDAAAGDVARRLLEALERPCVLEGRSVVIGASIGVATFPRQGCSSTELLKRADGALYRAKDAGRNAFRLFDDAMDEHALQALDLEQELRRALEDDEFELHYQPLHDSRDARVVGAEALIRWRHPTRGLVAPSEFIPVAESSGLIVAIGREVLRRACEDAARWRRLGLPDVDVSVNVSAVQLRRPELESELVEALRRSGLPVGALQVEITESALVQDEDAVALMLGRLNALGVKVWMDDFGTGYASLGYLRRFPFDGVKIDASFVRGLPDDPGNRAIVRAILAMSRSLGLGVVAEGVETVGEAALLRRERCERLQGYLYARPMPFDEFLEHCTAPPTARTGTDGP